VTKEKSIRKLNTTGSSNESIDYSNCAFGTPVKVENEVFILNEGGFNTLAQREATVGSIRAQSLSDDISSIVDGIANKDLMHGQYIDKLNNAYFFVDTTEDGKCDSCLVFSVLTKRWTEYNNYSYSDSCVYEDSNGNFYFLGGSAITGRVDSLEDGYTDNGNPILSEITTKSFDFDTPEILKTFETVELFGFINGTALVKCKVCVDDEEVTSEITFHGEDYVVEGDLSGLAVNPLGSKPLADATTDNIDIKTILYPFKARIPMAYTGSRIKIELYVDDIDTTFILQKASIYPYAHAVDLYYNDLIY
jgi:hypothetical protein